MAKLTDVELFDRLMKRQGFSGILTLMASYAEDKAYEAKGQGWNTSAVSYMRTAAQFDIARITIENINRERKIC